MIKRWIYHEDIILTNLYVLKIIALVYNIEKLIELKYKIMGKDFHTSPWAVERISRQKWLRI